MRKDHSRGWAEPAVILSLSPWSVLLLLSCCPSVVTVYSINSVPRIQCDPLIPLFCGPVPLQILKGQMFIREFLALYPSLPCWLLCECHWDFFCHPGTKSGQFLLQNASVRVLPSPGVSLKCHFLFPLPYLSLGSGVFLVWVFYTDEYQNSPSQAESHSPTYSAQGFLFLTTVHESKYRFFRLTFKMWLEVALLAQLLFSWSAYFLCSRTNSLPCSLNRPHDPKSYTSHSSRVFSWNHPLFQLKIFSVL